MPFQPPTEQPDKPVPAVAPAPPAATEALATPKRRGKKRPLFHLADRVFGRPLCVTEEKLETIMGVIGPRLANADSTLAFYDPDDDDLDEQEQSDPYKDMGIACIPVYGTLVKRSTGMSAMSGMTSYEGLSAKLQAALSDPSVKGIILDVDSPGGESDGMFDFADQIYQARGQKPMYACCNDQMCSAAYAIGCAADRIYTSRTGMLGSVGCYMVHVDQSEYDAQKGIKYTFIAAGARKVDGNSHEPLSKGAKSEMTAEVNRIRNMFAEMVARNRNVSMQSVMDTEAGVQFAAAAIPLFADQMGGCMDAAADMVKLFTVEVPVPGAAGADAAAVAEEHGDALAQAPGSWNIIYGTPTGRYSDTITPPPLLDAFAVTRVWLNGKECPIVNGAVTSAAESDDSVLIEGFDGRKHSVAEVSQGPAFAHALELLAALPAIRKDHPEAFAAMRNFSAQVSSASSGNRQISLLLVPYDGSSANLGSFKEIYRPGCFKNGLNGDLRVMFNHADSSQYILGRTSAGTARFWEDAEGVHAEATAPDTQWARDLITSMLRKDVTQASAGFWITGQSWETRNGERYRVVESAILHDGSVETFAAYETTRAVVQPDISASTGTPVAIASARLKILRLR